MNYIEEANAIAARLRPAPAPRVAAGPTPKALAVLAYCREFFAENDQLPPQAVISGHFGWASLNAAQVHIDALIRHKLLERNAVGKLRFARNGGAA